MMSGYITDINQLDFNKVYSYADYVLWKFKERVELIKGRIFKMSPAPNLAHQKVSIQLSVIFGNHFDKHLCSIFSAPVDVALLDKSKSTENQDIHTIVQPDLIIVCDQEKLRDGKKVIGAPDLVVEILSPGNSQKEMDAKFDLYQEAGVKEYWVVFPTEKMIQIFALQDGKYIGLKPCVIPNPAKGLLFPDMEVDLEKVFN